MASMFISQHTQLRLRLISASKCIANLAQSRPPSASLSSLDPLFSKCISKLARSRSRVASLSALVLSVSMFISLLARCWSQCAF
jgi:hypothetical protein